MGNKIRLAPVGRLWRTEEQYSLNIYLSPPIRLLSGCLLSSVPADTDLGPNMWLLDKGGIAPQIVRCCRK